MEIFTGVIFTSYDGDGDWVVMRRIPGAGSTEVGRLQSTPRGFETSVGRYRLGEFRTAEAACTAVSIYLGI